MTRSDALLGSTIFILTTAAFLVLLRWLAPQLLGIPVDLQLVQTSKTVPPFYEGVFQEQDDTDSGMLLNDPYTNVRFKPLQPANTSSGPHDLLGFRNIAVPNTVTLVTIGDSQTYGIGEALEDNWPSQLKDLLTIDNKSLYNMSVGGWGAVQYLYMFAKAVQLKPEIVIITFYSGNDSLEAFSTAYGNSNWLDLQPDPELDKTDAPAARPLLSLEDAWPVTFESGQKVIFTPTGRLIANNRELAAVRAGYAIMAEVARRISARATAEKITVFFTTIPTRELAYAERVKQLKLVTPTDYSSLVAMEMENIEELAQLISTLPGAHYIDLVKPLQSAAFGDQLLYPRMWDGHPGKQGYHVIAATLADVINNL